MSADPTISEAVRRGYDALIAAGHTPEAIRAAVLAGDFDMSRCSRCVIGHLYRLRSDEGYAEAVEALGSDDRGANAMGFDTRGSYEALADEWRRLVTEKAAPTIAPSAPTSTGTGGDAHLDPAGGVSDIAAATAVSSPVEKSPSTKEASSCPDPVGHAPTNPRSTP